MTDEAKQWKCPMCGLEEYHPIPMPYCTICDPNISLNGLRLRDHFAGGALTEVIASNPSIVSPKEAAARAYELADAMLRERAKPPMTPRPPIKIPLPKPGPGEPLIGPSV